MFHTGKKEQGGRGRGAGGGGVEDKHKAMERREGGGRKKRKGSRDIVLNIEQQNFGGRAHVVLSVLQLTRDIWVG